MAVGLRRVDPQDVPDSAKRTGVATSSAVASQPGPSQKKRKAESEAQHGTQPNARPLAPSQALNTQTQHLRQLVNHPIVIDDGTDDEDEPEDAVAEELYVTLRTNVVGVQYYTGTWPVYPQKCLLNAVLRRARRRGRGGQIDQRAA